MELFLLFLVPINIYAFYLMYQDKQYAKQKHWRISEAKFFTIAILLGSLGIMLGMQVFRHKTKHPSFIYGIPAIFIIQVVATIMALK